ncbi:MAG: arylsulfatase [Pseudomonas sp.]|uniref:arylsulfatase n=1 Tax=Pseudomonas sp. TaxID=306 RepID=UPI002736B262|nr:arylsulfatase [Pseudomonas sp.]MDP3846465.1 arylsulfatase [Pseudomonas sp.]
MKQSRSFKPLRSSLSLGVLAFGGLASSLAGAEQAALLPTPAAASTPTATDGKASPPAAPNILIIMLDDAGFAQADTVGGEIHTPTLSRISQSGIKYNAFHATAISSATRAALLTGRNHHRVGNGTVTEAATDDAGYTGIIPPTAATLPQVLHEHNYSSAAFGKWHNTPAHEVVAKGPFNHWPTSYGFDHFYGFMGGESDQYSPLLVNDTTLIESPHDPKYHFTEDIAQKAIEWIDQHQATQPDKPFFVYWTPGAVHAPHQVFQEWTDKYKGKFDSGWDAYRQRAFERQKALGWIPADTKLSPRPAELPAWDSLSAEEQKFQARLMEVYAGFLEHTDTQAGKIVDELERLGVRDNTLIFYVLSDNGASAEGMQGSISSLVGLNGIQTTPQQQMAALDKIGGLAALGGPKVEPHYNAAWAWAGMSPFVGTKLVAGYFGGTRTPLAVSWPNQIKPDATVRGQFHHVNDIAPTIYDILGITPPAELNGQPQLPIDGISLAYSFDNAAAENRKKQQYFEVMGSRAEYADGWVAAVLGPRKPWVADQTGLVSFAGKLAIVLNQNLIGDYFGWLKWKPEDDQWALYDLNNDFGQAEDVAAAHPEKLAELKDKFAQDAKANHVYPIGVSFDMLVRPRHYDDQAQWHLPGSASRIPEFAAPNIKSHNNRVSVDAELPANANGVLFALGGIGGGLSLYLQDGRLTYEYNGFGLVRTKLQASEPLPAGRAQIAVELNMSSRFRGAAADVSLSVNGVQVAENTVPFTAPIAFSATETLDVGLDRGAPVSLDYFDQAPFAFNGVINDVHIQYMP